MKDVMEAFFRTVRRWLLKIFRSLFRRSGPVSAWRGRRRDTKGIGNAPLYRNPRKPDWVAPAIVQLKALQPELSCREIAAIFNRVHAVRSQTTVGKTYVAGVIRARRHDILMLRQRVRNRKGMPGKINQVWGIDLTGKADISGYVHSIFGALDHGTRASLSLTVLGDKSSITLLRLLLNLIERYGKPKIIRTDNEAVFTSRLFRFGLAMLGIRHQTTDLHCPWQNGRIERFFGTLKQKLDRWSVPDFQRLEWAMAEFQFWYNAVRPHQSLHDRTPAEIWNRTDVYRRRSQKIHAFNTWDGLLAGIYLPP